MANDEMARIRADVLRHGRTWHAEGARTYGEISRGFFDRAGHIHDNVTSAIDQLEAMAANRDPRVTEAKHQEDVNRLAESLATRIESSAKRASNLLAEAYQAEHGVLEELGVTQDNRYGAEIRARLASMSEQERSAAIDKAIQSGDSAVIASILSAPSFVTGISSEKQSAVRNQYMQVRAPEYAGMVQAMKQSAERAEQAHKLAPEYLRQWINRSHEPGAEKATQAAQRFNEVLANL